MSDAFQNDVLVEETHSGRAWSLIILVALIGPAIGVALVPSTPGGWALALVAVIAIGTFAMTWSGFSVTAFCGTGLRFGCLDSGCARFRDSRS